MATIACGRAGIFIIHYGCGKGNTSHKAVADPGLTLGGGLSIPGALARAKFYALRPLLTSFLRW